MRIGTSSKTLSQSWQITLTTVAIIHTGEVCGVILKTRLGVL